MAQPTKPSDPIPDPEGAVHPQTYDTLLTCPLHSAMTISRVSDQDREFLERLGRASRRGRLRSHPTAS